MIFRASSLALLALCGFTAVHADCDWIRFNKDINHIKLKHGDSAETTFPGIWVPNLTVKDKQGEELLIYDTDFLGPRVTGADPDLEVEKGNAIIVQRPGFHDKTNPHWQTIGRPDDNPTGGWIVFHFPAPIQLGAMQFVDTDGSSTPFIDLYSGGTLLKRVKGPSSGGKEVVAVSFDPNTVVDRIEVKMRESGGILGIYACAVTIPKPTLQLTHIRAIDGSNSGVGGHQHAQLVRVCPAHYPGDNSGTVMYTEVHGLPNPRTISNTVFKQTESIPNTKNISDMIWAFGQLLDHDVGLTENAKQFGTEPVQILDPNDSLFGKTSGYMRFSRSEFDPKTGLPGIPRQQVNLVTSYVDASNVYGSDTIRANALRTFEGGLLETSAGDLMPFNLEGLPMAGGARTDRFLSGDVRANEQVGLTAMHTVFVREHNRLARLIAAYYNSTDDDLIYELARKIVGAEMQIITYKEWLPLVLGDKAPKLKDYKGYDPTVNAGLITEMSSAALRVGHTMLSPNLVLADNGGIVSQLPLELAFFNIPLLVADPVKVDQILHGFSHQKAQQIDNQVIESVRSLLFANVEDHAFDLTALNIQRGRDHGICPYNTVREAFGLPKAKTFYDITSNKAVADKISAAYSGNIDKVDIWVGAISEDHFPGANVGELICTILARQFENLMHGDTFFYLNDPDLHPTKIKHIIDLESFTLTKVLSWNTIYKAQPKDVFFTAA